MKQKHFLSLTLFIFCIGTMAKAQSCDPWITKAYQQLYKRSPITAECNIQNYNNGSWNNYDELVGYIKTFQAPAEVKGDPWIFQVYNELYYRKPNAWEVNIKNYNNGSWNNYNDLKKYIQDFQASIQKQGLQIKTAQAKGGKALVGFFINGQQTAADVVSMDKGKILATGSSILDKNNPSLIGMDGASLIGMDGGTLVGPDGGTISVGSNTAGVTFGNSFTLQTEGTKVITTSGKGALIIK